MTNEWNDFYKMTMFNKPNPFINQVNSRYVTDVLTEEVINIWCQTFYIGEGRLRFIDNEPKHIRVYYHWPVFISAPTGKGKNYFILHVLRKFAIKYKMRILLVSNRVALDYQQKQELAKLCLGKMHLQYDSKDHWKEKSEFGNVTVLTYHKLNEYMKDFGWCGQFAFVVFDECHFFFSDALFNPDTGSILENIGNNFFNSVRIYMSGTMDEVYEPIRYFESRQSISFSENDTPMPLRERIDFDPFYYEFARDYSAYDLRFFREDKLKNTLLDEICSSSSGKWLIFVNSIAQGRNYKEEILQRINGAKRNDYDLVTLIDSDSRNSTDRAVRYAWENLIDNGTFSSRILITTSVLDNGFSIKDKNLKNIVLFTDDRVEFLQELGRCRLDENSRLKLYIKIPSPTDIRNLENRYNRYCQLVLSTNPEEPYLLSEEVCCFPNGNLYGFVQSVWNNEIDERRSCIKLTYDYNKNALCPVINPMVPWCVRKMGESILTYRKYAEWDEKNAGILFKLAWLGIKPEYKENFRAEDYLWVDPIAKMKEYLKKYENTFFEKGSEDYNRFALDFVPLYIAIEGSANINRSSDRALWQYDAMKKRLETLRKHGVNYDLSGDKQSFKLINIDRVTE